VDTAAITVAAVLTYLCKSSTAALDFLPFGVYFFFWIGSMASVYGENKVMVLRSLNIQRMNTVTEHWVKEGRLLSPEEVGD